MRVHSILQSLAVCAATCVFMTAASAQGTYPSKPIRIVVDTQAGGAPDKIARAFGKFISERLGQPVVVDNRPGASGIIAAELVAAAPADGHTLMLCQSAIAIAPSMMKAMRLNPVTDLTPVTKLLYLQHVLLASPGLKANTVQELVAEAQRQPGAINFATIGPATPQRIATEMFMREAKIILTQVPYAGAPPLFVGLMTNEVQLAVASVSTAAPQVRAGKVKALAVLGSERASALPSLPTFKELGYQNISTPWVGVFAPAKTPANVLAVLNDAFAAAVRDPALREMMRDDGMEPVANNARAFGAEFQAEVAAIAQLVQALGIKPE